MCEAFEVDLFNNMNVSDDGKEENDTCSERERDNGVQNKDEEGRDNDVQNEDKDSEAESDDTPVVSSKRKRGRPKLLRDGSKGRSRKVY